MFIHPHTVQNKKAIKLLYYGFGERLKKEFTSL